MILTLDGRDYDLPAGTRVTLQFPPVAGHASSGTTIEVPTAAAGLQPAADPRYGLNAQELAAGTSRPTMLERQERAGTAYRARRKAKAGPGRGRKKCPEPACGLIVGNHTTECMCGHRW